MSYNTSRVVAQIDRAGREATVLERTSTGTNEFGNTSESHERSRKVLAFKTYPTRNAKPETTE